MMQSVGGMRLVALVVCLVSVSCVGTGGDPGAVVRVDLAREAIVVDQRDAMVDLVDRVDGWTAEQRAELRGAFDAQVDRYRHLAERERDYLEATGAPDWRDVAREAAAIGGELLERRGGPDG